MVWVVARAGIQSLAQELPHAADMAKKKKKKLYSQSYSYESRYLVLYFLQNFQKYEITNIFQLAKQRVESVGGWCGRHYREYVYDYANKI